MIIEVIPLEVQMGDILPDISSDSIGWPLQQMLLEGLHKILNLPDLLWDFIARVSRPT